MCKVDEKCPFVGNKKNYRWLWYTQDPCYKGIITHAFSRSN
ncbi:IS1 family transposase [Vibrio scophthalmi]